MPRPAILHYHLFKNAGTSLEQILQRNFPERWVSAEFPVQGGDNSAAVADWIRTNPQAAAFSTHTALGPVPRIEGVRLVTVMLLRDPVQRIRSAYRFERKQQADTWGAELAKKHDLEGYVKARLARPEDRQCRNFQTHRLASMVPGDGPELDRAITAMKQLSVVGLVEAFDAFLERLAIELTPLFPGFRAESVRANVTRAADVTEADRRVDALLEKHNAEDRALWQAARDWLEGAS